MSASLLLASRSPRRQELLRLLGSPFEVVAANIHEGASHEPARDKVRAVARRGAVTIGADTQVLLEGVASGKPASRGEASQMLLRLAGRTHEVVTDVSVVDGVGRALSFSVVTRVAMREFGRDEAEAYAATDEPLDVAGAYAAQGQGGMLIASLDGCLANVVGFPLCHAFFALRRAGRSFSRRPEVACQEHFAFTCPVWRHVHAQGRALRDGERYESWTGRTLPVPRGAWRLGDL